MKFVRIKNDNGIQNGVVSDGSVRIVSGDIFSGWQYTGETVPLEMEKLAAPLKPESILCIGRNYKAHALECGNDLPKKPVLFIKANSSLCGPNDAVPILPEYTQQVDYEAELAVVIGKAAKNVSPEEALDYVFGYTCANDVSARDCQYENGQWARGKSFDNFCPLGPWIETELDPLDLEIVGKRNGQIVQQARTSWMIFPIPYLISYLSKTMTLLPGTVLLTGTPSGVVLGVKENPQWLQAGESFEVVIEGIGSLKSVFV
jgi:2-keto-4-pentenoate hydratase/2-oxohepta-3-ene-1,7-dioic acid hydratase in catechol pathway